MAKSKSLRKKQDKFLLKVGLVFGGIFAVLIAALLIYNAVSPKLDYSDFEHVTVWEEMETQEEEKYLLYYYSESCYYCKQIKDVVLDFTQENQADAKVYLMDAGNMTGTRPFESGALGTRTPTLHVVVDGEIVQTVEGTAAILDVFDEIESGSHEQYSSN